MTEQKVCYSFASLEHIHHLITPHMFKLKLSTLRVNVHERRLLSFAKHTPSSPSGKTSSASEDKLSIIYLNY